MRVSALLTALTTLALSTGAFAKHSTAPWKRVHRRHVNHSEGGDAPKYGHDGHHEPQGQYDVQKITGREFELEKRFDNGRFSFYDAGLGACGIVNSGSDFIVALNSAQFDQGGWCFKKITISIGGKSTEATITDRCPGCPYGGLDFSRGLFGFFAAESVGIIHGAWSLGGGGGPPPPPPPAPKVDVEWKKPKPSPPPPPPPPPPPAPSSTSEYSSSSATPSSSSSSAAPSSSSDASTSTSASTYSDAPSPTYKPEDHKGCVENLDLAMIHLGAMIVGGAEAGQVLNSGAAPTPSSS